MPTLSLHPAAKAETVPKRLTILGSTGTIGLNTIKLVEENRAAYEVEALTARNSIDELIVQARHLKPRLVVIENEAHYSALKEALEDTGIEVATGQDAINQAASRPCDLLMSGIVGAAALAPTLAAIRQGTTIGLANKECLVCAGDLMTNEVKKHNATLIPVDSEHNAVFQCFDFSQEKAVEKVTLTASGGPFLHHSSEAMATMTAKEAVNHPNWKMGAKISVDSATMMNKGLELIEAYHLFPIAKEQLDIIVHPQSIIHALVSYTDGSVIAGLSQPDMCVPIAYALGWPERISTKTPRLNLSETGNLTFELPDEDRFPAIALAKKALHDGGLAPTILNASNEVAVESFIAGRIGFPDITRIVANTLDAIAWQSMESLEQVIATDRQARALAQSFIR